MVERSEMGVEERLRFDVRFRRSAMLLYRRRY